jgi:site-specific DNA recombinase
MATCRRAGPPQRRWANRKTTALCVWPQVNSAYHRLTDHSAEPELISVAWRKPPSRRSREILLPHGTLREHIRPERAERRARLVTAIARGRRWLDQLSSGAVTDAHQLAKRKRCTVRQVNLTLSLAFLAPQLVKAAVEGRLPRGINIERLRDPHAEWSRQFQELGLDPH